VGDEALTRYVNLVGRSVALQSTRRGEIPFVFGVVDTDEVNAFAAPGGYVLLTRGALARMDSEAELAGVLAHEIAHVDETHVLDEIRRSSVLADARDEAQLTGFIMDRLAEAGGSLLFTGLSREDELEADSLGAIYAAASGYRPDGLLRFLERLDEEAAADSSLREWTATHPSESDRVEALRRQFAASDLDLTSGRDLPERFRAAVHSTDPGPAEAERTGTPRPRPDKQGPRRP
jgi:predicted Zn-dependent protease